MTRAEELQVLAMLKEQAAILRNHDKAVQRLRRWSRTADRAPLGPDIIEALPLHNLPVGSGAGARAHVGKAADPLKAPAIVSLKGKALARMCGRHNGNIHHQP